VGGDRAGAVGGTHEAGGSGALGVVEEVGGAGRDHAILHGARGQQPHLDGAGESCDLATNHVRKVDRTAVDAGASTPVAMGGSARARSDGPDRERVGPPPAPAMPAPWEVRPVLAAGAELERVQRWMSAPHVAEHWAQDWDLPTWSAEVARQLAHDHSRPFTVWLDGDPLAYVEVYRVARDVVSRHVTVGAADLGVHLAMGDPTRTGKGLGRRLLVAVADGLVAAEPVCEAVWGDPAARHGAARRAFAAAGFTLSGEVDLGHKVAALMVRRRMVPLPNHSC
jgi:lysine N-acyltransferase